MTYIDLELTHNNKTTNKIAQQTRDNGQAFRSQSLPRRWKDI